MTEPARPPSPGPFYEQECRAPSGTQTAGRRGDEHPSASSPSPRQRRGQHMIRNMQIRSKLIAVLVVPLVALTVLAAIGIGANVARGVQADRVNDQTDFAVSLSTLVHELQRERDLSAGWVGSGRSAGYGGVIAQRVAVNQALQTFRRNVDNLRVDEGSPLLQQRLETALRQFNRLSDERLQIEDEAAWTVPRTLDFYSGIIANLF